MNGYIGIDIGSQASKGVVIADHSIIAHYTCASGVNHRQTAEKIRAKLLDKTPHIRHIRTAATGCGANRVAWADDQCSDIQSLARGICFFDNTVRTVVEVGDRFSRVVRLGQGGMVIDFSMNHRCATGAGVFLQVIAKILQLDIGDIGPLSLKSTAAVRFDTGCAVFGETEVITRICEGHRIEDILAGAHHSLAEKIAAMVKGIGLEKKCALAGGGGLNTGLAAAIRKALGIELVIPPRPDIIGALGAAVIAGQKSGHQAKR